MLEMNGSSCLNKPLLVLVVSLLLIKKLPAQLAFDPGASFFFEIPADTAGVFADHALPFGGISAIAYTGTGNDYYLLSDGLPARCYIFTIVTNGGLQFSFKSMFLLPNALIRGEGAGVANDVLYISDERTIANIEKTAVWQLGAAGLTEIAGLPGQYRGAMYDNSGFEGLAVNPSGTALLLGMERAVPSSDCRSIVPIIEYSLESKTSKTYFYPMQWPTDGNGISALLSLSDIELLVIERDYLKDENRNEVGIFDVTLTGMAKSNSDNCPSNDDTVLLPRKLFSFSDVLSIGGKPFKVNNIEGAAFTPDKQYLLLVSDNNFGNKGRATPTQIIALKIVSGK